MIRLFFAQYHFVDYLSGLFLTDEQMSTTINSVRQNVLAPQRPDAPRAGQRADRQWLRKLTLGSGDSHDEARPYR